MEVKLYPHQKKAVDQLHNGSILWGDVGTGKSLTAIAYYIKNYTEYGEDLDIYVITTAKKRDSLDWEREAARYGIGKSEDASVKGVLTVDSWNNIGKYVDVERAFFIFDEQRLVGSGSWVKAFTKIAKQNQWILLSATPGDTWLDYIPVFVANGFYKNRTAFLREHVIYNTYSKFPKVDRYVGVSKLVRYRNDLLVHMQYIRHTTRVTEKILVDYDHDLFERVLKKRWHVFEQRPLKGVAELFLVMRKVVNSDSSRMQKLRLLMLKHPRLIVFYNFDYELEMLRNLSKILFEENLTTDSSRSMKMSSNSRSVHTKTSNTLASTTSSSRPSVSIAEWNGHKHQPIPTSDRWIYLVQYQAGAEGWNCTATDAMVFYSLTYSYKFWHQAHGRIDRLNTTFSKLYYYILMSDSLIDRAIWRSLSSKKSFNEARFISELTNHSQES